MRYLQKRHLVFATLFLSCCLTGSVRASAAEDISAAATPESGYNGIEIDGSFQDWSAVTKTKVDSSALESAAAVFDGDTLYLYIKEKSDGAALRSGPEGTGQFTILTDTGRKTNFKLGKKKIRGIQGAKVKNSDCQYEISIPISQIKQYKNSISFGYDLEDSMILNNIKNLQTNSTDKNFRRIIYDGLYSDWNYLYHTTLSRSDSKEEDAEAALYVGGRYIFGHVKYSHSEKKEKPGEITLRVNQKDKTSINLRLVKIEADGTINSNWKLGKLSPGMYEFGLWDEDQNTSVTNAYAPESPLCGMMYITIRADESEIEYKVSLDRLATELGISTREIKVVEAQYSAISNQWVSTEDEAETEYVVPTAVGLGICGVAVLTIPLLHRRKRDRIIKEDSDTDSE
jgi:hypothetical protein